mgnify:CR=1 FL=1
MGDFKNEHDAATHTGTASYKRGTIHRTDKRENPTPDVPSQSKKICHRQDESAKKQSPGRLGGTGSFAPAAVVDEEGYKNQVSIQMGPH